MSNETDNADLYYLDSIFSTDWVPSESAHFQRVKIGLGADGVFDGDVSETNPMPIRLGDSSYDAFSRLRTAGTGRRLDTEFIYDLQPDFYDVITNGPSASVSHNGNTRDVTLAGGTTASGHFATLRSHPVPSTPGNSQLIDITGTLDNASVGGGTAQVFLRSKISGAVTEQVIDQSSWLSNTTGIDWSTSQILSMDFQSLKVGTIRFWLVKNGAPVQIAQINNDNLRASGYWQIPSLPVYWRVYNDATYTYMEMGYGDEDNAIGIRYRVSVNASATVRAICATVKSEGGPELEDIPGVERCIDTGVTPKTISTTLVPILSIRARDTFKTFNNLAIVEPSSFEFQTSESVKLAVIVDGTLTGASWSDVDTNNSVVEFDTSATVLTGGKTVLAGYRYATTSGAASGRVSADEGAVLGKTVLWNRQGSETGILTLAAVRTGASDASVLAGLQWREIK